MALRILGLRGLVVWVSFERTTTVPLMLLIL